MENTLQKTYHFKDFQRIYEVYNAARQYPFDVDAKHDTYVVDCKSLMGLMSLNTKKPIDIILHTDDEKLAQELFQKIDMIVV